MSNKVILQTKEDYDEDSSSDENSVNLSSDKNNEILILDTYSFIHLSVGGRGEIDTKDIPETPNLRFSLLLSPLSLNF
ncbi:5817_t:CDS:2 [Diversispora eburnea]|uniref:5817_t:CDS:1 n=1 Tax=Diversispora eburnea TaxID=1213867 RepID=A0A9N9BL07_9GLOM|nr:5817_t:CDS:2 [Diversispora eburnea]